VVTGVDVSKLMDIEPQQPTIAEPLGKNSVKEDNEPPWEVSLKHILDIDVEK